MNSNRVNSLLQQPRTVIMGIVNVTPDSFSDGGQYLDADAAVNHALALVEEGADLLDVGGESTRPGADEVSLQQELDRVIPVIERLQQAGDTPISIDTYKPEVMRAALQAGASMVNDVNALRAEGALQIVAEAGVPICLMHMHGLPKTMQDQPVYDDVVSEVISFLVQRINACQELGIPKQDIIVDPGIGFGKSLDHNLALLSSITQIRAELRCETLIGVSRKSMIDELLNRKVSARSSASVGLAVQAALNGAKIVRVHDVQATHDALRSVEAVLAGSVG